MLNLKNARLLHEASQDTQLRNSARLVARAMARDWRVQSGKVLMQPEGKATLCNGFSDFFCIYRQARWPQDAAEYPRPDGIYGATKR